MLEKIDNAMYLIIWILEDWSKYYSRDSKVRNESKKNFITFKKEIKTPEVSIEGIRKRLFQIKAFEVNIIFYGVILIISSIFFNFFVLNLSLDIIIIITSVLLYPINFIIPLYWRLFFANSDIRKFERNKSHFLPNLKAIPKVYDLVPGLFICFLQYNFISFVVFF